MTQTVPSSPDPGHRQNPPVSVAVTVVAQFFNILSLGVVYSQGDNSGFWFIIGAILFLLLGLIILKAKPDYAQYNERLATWLGINNLYMFFTGMKFNLFPNPEFDPGQGGGAAFSMLLFSFCFMGPLALGLYFQTIRLLIGLFRLRQYGIWLWLGIILTLAPPLLTLIFLISVAFV